jgi:L-arabinose transport system ATP-binding protein
MKDGAISGELQRDEFKEQTALRLAMLGQEQAAA